MGTITRRESLKYITLASISAGMLIRCTPEHEAGVASPVVHNARYKLTEEDLKLLNQQFFTQEEMETVRQLSNLIIPADDHSGNAEDAGVPKFIDFMMLDKPEMQTNVRGGLRWLDFQCLKQFEKEFRSCSVDQQKQLLDQIAYPDNAKPEMSQGVSFFNRFRDLVASGFWSSKMGMEDIGYMGNVPTIWNGPPQEWLDKLGVLA
jgi:hypothetical protein